MSAICCSSAFATPSGDDPSSLRTALESYFKSYDRKDMVLAPSSLGGVSVDSINRVITINADGGFVTQYFTPEVVDVIYDGIHKFIPDSYHKYNVVVQSNGHPIEQLVPNMLRNGKKDTERLQKDTYKGNAWVKNVSRPYNISEGLEGTHIALWQSHGLYWKNTKDGWTWQRPHLFCTAEDVFSQTFVVPYIIPMLQNAGAVVYTPRERDWQNNEVIVDNDNPDKSGTYREQCLNDKRWQVSELPGFAHNKLVYNTYDSPFTDGTARYIPTVASAKEASFAQWMPDIPEDGSYAVYVSYQTLAESVDDAHYVVYHNGAMTEYHVNQTIGGGTWVYLGTFYFKKGKNNDSQILLYNDSHSTGVVSADAVKIGGGMGNIARGATAANATVSGFPRWNEAARYSAQWSGFSKDEYEYSDGSEDYKSDIVTRSRTINKLGGGSIFMPNMEGRGVPFELSMAFHTDAGYKTTRDLVGTLSICSSDFYGGKTANGVSRFASRDLATLLLTNLDEDLKDKYGWVTRKLLDRNYGETREPQVPSIILEMLSHQNFADLSLGYDPKFKFDFCRSVYKTVVKYLAYQHQRHYVIQPLPVKDFAAIINEKKHTVELSWRPTHDPKEKSAVPTEYIVYTRKGNGDFDNGRVVKGTSVSYSMTPGNIYSFRVTAVNKGGESFPSETLSAYLALQSQGNILIVNAFDRLEGPAEICTSSQQGFDLDLDPGVQYGKFAGFVGRQKVFDLKNIGSELSTGTGYSGKDLEGKIIMGNTFDYPFVHGKGIAQLGNYSFSSISESALIDKRTHLHDYKMVDVIYGVQKVYSRHLQTMLADYLNDGGRLFVSGANINNATILLPQLHAQQSDVIQDKGVTSVGNGNDMSFSIYREMNDKCYPVPTVLSVSPQAGAYTMLTYVNGMSAATAYEGSDYKAVCFGFPLESITDIDMQNKVMTSVTHFLCK